MFFLKMMQRFLQNPQKFE